MAHGVGIHLAFRGPERRLKRAFELGDLDLLAIGEQSLEQGHLVGQHAGDLRRLSREQPVALALNLTDGQKAAHGEVDDGRRDVFGVGRLVEDQAQLCGPEFLRRLELDDHRLVLENGLRTVGCRVVRLVVAREIGAVAAVDEPEADGQANPGEQEQRGPDGQEGRGCEQHRHGAVLQEPGQGVVPGGAVDGGEVGVLTVGVQRRNRRDELLGLVPGDASSATWTLECNVVRSATDVDLKGPYIQGSRGERFIYLSWGTVDDEGRFSLFRRAKLWLDVLPIGVMERATSSCATVTFEMPIWRILPARCKSESAPTDSINGTFGSGAWN